MLANSITATAQEKVDPSSVVEPRGRLALASFSNSINNVNPANYMWVKAFSNYTLCHKMSGPTVQPWQALTWIVGDVDSLNLGTAEPY
jgi:hypothetical protein